MGLFGSGDKESNSHRGGFKAEEVFSHSPGEYTRIIDEEAEVVLYGASVNAGFGLAAVPLEDTALEIHEESNQSEGQGE